MISFLFWNLHRKPLQEIIANLALSYEVNVLMLVECSIAPGVLLTTLNQCRRAEYHYAPDRCEKVEIFTRYPRQFIKPICEENRLTIRHLKLPGTTEILLAVTHFISKLHSTALKQASESRELSHLIRLREKKLDIREQSSLGT